MGRCNDRGYTPGDKQDVYNGQDEPVKMFRIWQHNSVRAMSNNASIMNNVFQCVNHVYWLKSVAMTECKLHHGGLDFACILGKLDCTTSEV